MSQLDNLNRAAARRQANWAAYPKTNAIMTLELTDQLEDLWAEVRLERAQHRTGDNSSIIKRARVEREIERLASSNGS